jgi:8-oxo-dGTP diphosphatase
MTSSPLLLVVAAALIDSAGRVLVQQRPEGRGMAGLWEFPGGKVEPGETPEAALVRELAEELGITVDPGDCRPLAFASAGLDRAHLLLLLYTIERWQGAPAALEAAGMAWHRPAALRTLAMPPADVPLVDALVAHLGEDLAGDSDPPVAG